MAYKRMSLNINGISRKFSKLAYSLSELAENFSLIPNNDPKQALRIKRFFISIFVYLLNMPLSYLAYTGGLMEFKELVWGWSITTILMIILYIVFRSGLNKRMKDPSLTFAQISVASLVVMYGLFFVPEAKGILFAVYVLILLFGTFRLDTRQFLKASAFIRDICGGYSSASDLPAGGFISNWRFFTGSPWVLFLLPSLSLAATSALCAVIWL